MLRSTSKFKAVMRLLLLLFQFVEVWNKKHAADATSYTYFDARAM